MVPCGRGPGFLLNRSSNGPISQSAGISGPARYASVTTLLLLFIASISMASLSASVFAQQPSAPPSQQNQQLPDVPAPQAVTQPVAPAPSPCFIKRTSVGIGWNAAWNAGENAVQKAPSSMADATAAGAAAVTAPSASAAAQPPAPTDAELVPCTAAGLFLTDLGELKNLPIVKQYARFLDGPQAKRMTPKQKAWLAVRNVADPFNAITIMGSSAVAVASNSHSAYGPGFPGWGRYVGVSYSQDMTAEFFGTFLIPSIVHQDPHYHRMPAASIKRRIAHVIYQVVWTQGDDGQGMINYADLAGFGIDDEIANLYVPDRQTNSRATAERYAGSLALAPTDNAITEFLPDIAKKIHVRVVLIQQIINQIANKDATNTAP